MLKQKTQRQPPLDQFEYVLSHRRPASRTAVWYRPVLFPISAPSLVDRGELPCTVRFLSVATPLPWSLSNGPVLQAVRAGSMRLGLLRFARNQQDATLVEMRLPEQIRALRPAKMGFPGLWESLLPRPSKPTECLEDLGAPQNRSPDLERGVWLFYCPARTPPLPQSLDHSCPARAHAFVRRVGPQFLPPWFPSPVWNA